MKKAAVLVLSLLVGMFLLGPIASGGAQASGKPVFLAFSGGPSSGVFGKAGAGVAVVLKNLSKGRISATSQSSTGGQENIVIVNSGKAEMGVSSAPDVHEAYYGKGSFEGKKQSNIRLVGIMIKSVANFVTLESSGYKTMKDLIGKKVSCGSPTSSSRGLTDRLFSHLGMDYKRVFLAGGPAAKALKDGHVDAYFWAPSMPAPDLVDLSSTKKVRLLDCGTEAGKTGFFEKYPFYAPFTIPAGTYRGVDYDVPSLTTGIYWIVNKDVDEDLVYDMTKLAYENTKACKAAFGPLKAMRPNADSVRLMDIPLHAGAQKYWKEKGVKISDALMAR